MAGGYSYLVLLALCGITCVLTEGDQKWRNPTYCNGLECPRFTVIKTTKDYELRKYEASKWVITEMEGMDYEATTSIMFRRLFSYITGNNDMNKKIDMTSPVLIRVYPGPGPACPTNFTMGFFVDPVEANATPKPSDSNVKLATFPEWTVYTKHFGGHADGMDYVRAAAELNKVLPTGTKFDRTYYFNAGYDSPMKPFNRRNEVWFTAL